MARTLGKDPTLRRMRDQEETRRIAKGVGKMKESLSTDPVEGIEGDFQHIVRKGFSLALEIQWISRTGVSGCPGRKEGGPASIVDLIRGRKRPIP